MARNKKKPIQPGNFLQKMFGTVVIVGCSGFKGSKLLESLEKDARFSKIIAIDKKKPTVLLKKARFYKVDLTEPMADSVLIDIFNKEKAETLFHAALPVSPPKNGEYAHELISVGTMYVLNAAARSGVKKVILATTTSVYGAFASNPNFLQEDRHEPKGYLQSKFLADKIDAEKQALKFAKKYPDRCVTILRPCTILGPTVESYKTRYLKRFFVTTVLGFDPLMQFVHEDDMVQAFRLAIEKDCPGVFNIVGDGVLPLSRTIELMGKLNLRIPQIGFKTLVQLMWYADLSPAPSTHVDFLRYLCVADGRKAKNKLNFVPRYSSKEALLSFIGAERLREATSFLK